MYDKLLADIGKEIERLEKNIGELSFSEKKVELELALLKLKIEYHKRYNL